MSEECLSTREKDSLRVKKWVAANRERSREIKKAYKVRNREAVLKAKRERAKKVRASRSQSDKDKVRIYNREYHHKRYPYDVRHRLSVILRTRLYKAVKGIARWSRTSDLLGCSMESFKMHMESLFLPGMTWDNYGKWHIDHILPCAIFDLTKEDQQKYCFHFSNMQPLWALDNIKKSDKV